MYELKLDATIENLNTVSSFLEEIMEEHGVPMKVQMQLAVAVEEIYVNIAHYSYPVEGGGKAKVTVDFPDDGRNMVIQFMDSGTPYDPLKKPDPDITLSADDRPIGGLGIFMVKKTMDDMSYVYENGCNILTLVKSF